jgi:hypothetical protein
MPASPESIQQQVEQEQYDKALASYEKLKEEEKAAVNVKDIEKARSSYETKQVKSIEAAIRKHQYRQANEQYLQTLNNIPSSEKVQRLADELNEEQEQYRIENTIKQKMLEAEFYIDEKPLLEKLYQVEANNTYYLRLHEQRQQSRAELAQELGQYGLAELNKGHKNDAYDLLTLANKLEPSEQWSKPLSSIKREQQKKKAVAKKKAERKQQSQFQILQEKYQALDHEKSLLASQKLLQQIAKLSLKGDDRKWYNKEKAELQEHVDQYVERGTQRGQVLYSKGRIEDAIKVWKDSYQLAPNDPKLRDNIERAEKFLAKFNELQRN